MNKKVTLPKKVSLGEAYNFHDITNFIYKKTGKSASDWAGKFTHDKIDAPYQDFWHWITDTYNPQNNEIFSLSLDIEAYHKNYLALSPWVVEILTFLKEEFKQNSIEVFYAW